MHDPFHHAGGHRAAGDGPIRVAGPHAVVKDLTIAQQQPRHLAALFFAQPHRAPRGRQRFPRAPRPRSQLSQFGRGQKKEIIRLVQNAGGGQGAPAVQQRLAHDSPCTYNRKLGRFTQAGERAYAPRGRARQARFEPAAFAMPYRLRQAFDGGLGGHGAALKNDIGRLAGVCDVQVTLHHLHDLRGVFAPARPADVNFGHAAHAITLQKGAERRLRHRRQLSGLIGRHQRGHIGFCEGGSRGRVCFDLLGRCP